MVDSSLENITWSITLYIYLFTCYWSLTVKNTLYYRLNNVEKNKQTITTTIPSGAV